MQRDSNKSTDIDSLHLVANNVKNTQYHDGVSRGLSLNGFTLIELLVVVSIIALLVSILLPSLSKAREQAKSAVCRSHLKSIALSAMIYSQENNDEVLPVYRRYGGFSTSFACHWTYLQDPYPVSWASPGPWGLGYLYTSGIIENDSEIGFCPSGRARSINGDKISKNNWNSKGVQTHWNYLGPGSSIGNLTSEDTSLGWINLRLTYALRPLDSRHEFYGKKLSVIKTVAFISDIWLAWMADHRSSLMDMGHAPANGAYGQLNAAYTDGHVESIRLNKEEFFEENGKIRVGTTWKQMFGR